LRSAIVEVTRATRSWSSSALSAIGVATQPGCTRLTRPRGQIRTISFLSVSINPESAAFELA
jgi:hypothetical protein